MGTGAMLWSIVLMLSGKISNFLISIIPSVHIAHNVTTAKLDLIFSGCLTCQHNEIGMPYEGWCYKWHKNWLYIAHLSRGGAYIVYFARSISELIEDGDDTFTMLRVELNHNASSFQLKVKVKEPNPFQRLLLEFVTFNDYARECVKRSIIAERKIKKANVINKTDLNYHSMLLIGPPGIGKSDFAQIIAYLMGAKCHPSIDLCVPYMGTQLIFSGNIPTCTNRYAIEFSEFNCVISKAFAPKNERYSDSSCAKNKSSLFGFLDWLKEFRPNLFILATMNTLDVLRRKEIKCDTADKAGGVGKADSVGMVERNDSVGSSMSPIDVEALLRRFELTVHVSADSKRINVLRATPTMQGMLFESNVFHSRGSGKNSNSGSWNSGYVTRCEYKKTNVADWLASISE